MGREMTSHPRTALVIGATGSFGVHAAAALVRHGWTLKALARDPVAAQMKVGPGMAIDWIQGDAMNREDVVAAAEGVAVIVHAVNPPGYRNWQGLVGPMMENSIAAAEASGARIVLPGNVYNFAPDAGEEIAEDAVQAPATRKGRIRAEMEARLHASGVKTLVLRAGDFFGPAAPNSVLSWRTRRSKDRIKAVLIPGPDAVGHAYAYMPDLAETLARLLEREVDLATFEVFHFRGHYLAADRELCDAVAAAAPGTRREAFPWAVVWALSPFVETFRELWEMRYLWRKPIGLANAKLVAFLGEEPHTPLREAIRETLVDMGAAA